jgi:hypothetical protein
MSADFRRKRSKKWNTLRRNWCYFVNVKNSGKLKAEIVRPCWTNEGGKLPKNTLHWLPHGGGVGRGGGRRPTYKLKTRAKIIMEDAGLDVIEWENILLWKVKNANPGRDNTMQRRKKKKKNWIHQNQDSVQSVVLRTRQRIILFHVYFDHLTVNLPKEYTAFDDEISLQSNSNLSRSTAILHYINSYCYEGIHFRQNHACASLSAIIAWWNTAGIYVTCLHIVFQYVFHRVQSSYLHVLCIRLWCSAPNSIPLRQW